MEGREKKEEGRGKREEDSSTYFRYAQQESQFLTLDFAIPQRSLRQGKKRKEGRKRIFPTLASLPLPLLPVPLSIGMANLLQSGGKVGVGNSSSFCPVNVSNTCGVEGCDRQTHRYSVVGVAVNIRAGQRSSPGNF